MSGSYSVAADAGAGCGQLVVVDEVELPVWVAEQVDAVEGLTQGSIVPASNPMVDRPSARNSPARTATVVLPSTLPSKPESTDGLDCVVADGSGRAGPGGGRVGPPDLAARVFHSTGSRSSRCWGVRRSRSGVGR